MSPWAPVRFGQLVQAPAFGTRLASPASNGAPLIFSMYSSRINSFISRNESFRFVCRQLSPKIPSAFWTSSVCNPAGSAAISSPMDGCSSLSSIAFLPTATRSQSLIAE